MLFPEVRLKGLAMKTKVLLLGLAVLLTGSSLLIVGTSQASEDGYYFSWYPSCTTGPCNAAYSHWAEGTGISECQCCSPGYWPDCGTATGDQACIKTWKLYGSCNNKVLVDTTNGLVCDSSALH
jgi:hypothetical protein